MKFTFVNTLNWILGLIILSLGISFALASNVGLTSYDASWTNLSELIGVSVGTGALIFASIFLTIIMIIDFNWKYLFCVLSNIIIGYTVELFTKLFMNTEVVGFDWMSFVVGVLLIGLGVMFFIKSNLPPSVPEQFLLSLVKIFKTSNIKLVKIGVDIFFLITAISFAILAGIGFGEVSYGTFILAIVLGPLIAFYSTCYDSILKWKKNIG